jgi:undecaprenyl-phosphate 4-deoxy-4-formamido-L-arabinose transferase
MSTLSVVIPVFNSESIMPTLMDRLEGVLTLHASRYEVILVNDGSRDRSWNVVCELAQERDWIHGINLMRNYGQHNAVLCGIRAAKYETVITMDDDLQHPPEEIPKLLKEMTNGFDVVYGIPSKLPHSLWRNLLSRFTKRAMARAMGLKSIQDISAFRAFKTELRNAFASYQSPHLLLDVLLSWGTTRFGAVEVDHRPRLSGDSNYSFLKLCNQAMLMLTGFSTTPLRVASLVGFGFTLFGISVLFYVVGRYVAEGSIPGFPFLASIISLFSGAQLFALGIIGEYLARMFNRTVERPTYVIGTSTEQYHDSKRSMGYAQSREVEAAPGREIDTIGAATR